MKAAHRKQVQDDCKQLLQIHFEVVPAQGETYNVKDGYFIWSTPIGKARLRLDMGGKSKIMTLFVNFYENTAIAKKVLGHWKQNLHSDETLSFPHHIEQHLTELLDNIKESDGWMFMMVKERLILSPGLQLVLSQENEDAITELSRQTLFSEKWIRENLDTIKELETEEKEIL